MRSLFRTATLLGFSYLVTLNAHAADAGRSSYTLEAAELSGIVVTQGSNKSTTSGELAWTPMYWFNDMFALRGNFGISAFRATDRFGNQSTFTVFDGEVLARYYFTSNWDVEAGGGMQSWVNEGGPKGVISFNVGYHPSKAWGGFLDRVFAGYSDAFQNVNASEFRIGLGAIF